MKARLFDADHGTVAIQCPGCECEHYLNVSGDHSPRWGFNNNYDKPTFTPSVLVKSGKYAGGGDWFNSLDDERKAFVEKQSIICHSFIREGRIEFLNDCTHALAGQTIELPEYGTLERSGGEA